MLATLLLLLAGNADAGQCWIKDDTSIRYVGDRRCVTFQPARTFHGLFVDCFEGIRYVDRGRTMADVGARHDDVWLELDSETRHLDRLAAPRTRCHVSRITFRGRAARDMHRQPLEGYGHLGMSPGVVIVDDLLAAKDLGPLRRQP